MHGSDEEIDDPPDVDSDEDLTDDEHKENQDEVSALYWCLKNTMQSFFKLFTMFSSQKWMERKGRACESFTSKEREKTKHIKRNEYNSYYMSYLKSKKLLLQVSCIC